MNTPTSNQNETPDMATELGRIEGEIAIARRLVDTQQLPDVSGLLPRISEVCHILADLPRAEAHAHLETIRRLIVSLDGLATRLTENQNALREQHSTTGHPSEHP
jgi:hypothetical protein